jgi:hypothetical protein
MGRSGLSASHCESDRGGLREVQARGPSLSTSGETLTIEESMNLEGENGERRNVGDEHEWSDG